MSFNSKLNKLFNKLVKNKMIIGSFLAAVVIMLAAVTYWSIAPSNFPKRTIVSIKDGDTLSQAARLLQDGGIVRSQFVYKVFTVLLGGKRKVIAGDYLFDSPQSALRVAWRTVEGDEELPQIKVTIPEGIASYDIARLLADKMPNFDSKAFLAIAKPKEGYLFPNTYYFYETISPQEIVDMMANNFNKHIKNEYLQIRLFGKTESDVIKMASIVEKEATSTNDRRTIAGILWKRINSDYPLQVDPPFFYTLGKDSSELTMADLTSDSPYNLYTHKGLPPTPIDNPGLSSIADTVNPITTDYWFYLSDSNGNMHYAATNDGQIANREKYLQ